MKPSKRVRKNRRRIYSYSELTELRVFVSKYIKNVKLLQLILPVYTIRPEKNSSNELKRRKIKPICDFRSSKFHI